MSSQDPPLLVVCHEATRTGGSRVVVELLEAARDQLPHPISIRVLAGGPLLSRLSTLADVEDCGQIPRAVIVNSALAAASIDDLVDVPTMIYVHEESDALAGLPQAALQRLTSAGLAKILCVSAASRAALVDLGAIEDRIEILLPLVNRPATPSFDELANAREELDATGKHLVVGCGEASWRKGADLFVEVARLLKHRHDLRFAWIGRRPRGFVRRLDHDASRLSEQGLVHWHGEVAETSSYLAAADLLLMTSREDPQPLVPLEAAHLGTATAAFDIGGLADLARSGAAATMPFPDTRMLAAEVLSLLGDEDRRTELIQAARRRAVDQLPDVVVPAFVDAVNSLLNTGSSSTL